MIRSIPRAGVSFTRRGAWALALSTLVLGACASPGSSASSTAGAGGSSSSTTSSSSGGAGGANASAGRSGAGFVASGNRSASSAHAAVSSLGEGPGENTVCHSSKYRFVGGIVAATQP